MVLVLMVAAAFNLACTGQGRIGEIGKPVPVARSISKTYRLDLDAKRWCEGACKETRKIAEITDTEIRLVFVENSQSPTGFDAETVINRESGNWLDSDKSGDFYEVNVGTCKPAPFSGFPQRQF